MSFKFGLRALLALVAALALGLGAAACGDDDEEGGDEGGTTEAALIESNPDNEGVEITVGSKNFTEQYILGEIYAQALEAAGYTVQKDLNLGSEVIAKKALEEGEIDAYPEYSYVRREDNPNKWSLAVPVSSIGFKHMSYSPDSQYPIPVTPIRDGWVMVDP